MRDLSQLAAWLCNASNLALRKVLRKCLPRLPRGHFHLQLLVLFFVALGCCRIVAPASATAQDAPVATTRVGTTFTVADFDGDGLPDLATVEAVQNRSSSTNYRILVRLSSSERVSIHVAAPSGGLVIEAVDVNNRNHFIDLALTTAWSRQPVATLINDGSGSFSRVPPSAFPDVFVDASTEWASASEPTSTAVGVPLQRRSAMHSQSGGVASVQLQIDSAPPSNSFFFCVCPLIFKAGRAPPLGVRCS